MRKIAFSIADVDFHLIQNYDAEIHVTIFWDESMKEYTIQVKNGDIVTHTEKRDKNFIPTKAK